MFNLSSSFKRELKSHQKGKRWRELFHAKDFQSLMYPCFTFCCILGIFPYKINASTFETSRSRYILSTILTCICGIYTLLILHGLILYISISGKIDMFIFPMILVDSCVFFFGGFIVAVTFILSGPRMRLLQIILKISSRLSSKSYKKISRLIHAKDIIGFFYLLGNMCYIYYIYSFLNLQINVLQMIIMMLFQQYIGLVVFQMDMMYMNCVCVLKNCFKKINDNLTHMRELMANHSYESRQIYHEQKNSFLIMELKTLKKQHLTISDTVQMLNTISSLHLLTTIVLTFSEITIYIYYFILNYIFMFLPKSTSLQVLLYIYFSSRLAYKFIKLALIVWASETSKNQVLQITTSIHDTLNSITDEEIRDEVV